MVQTFIQAIWAAFNVLWIDFWAEAMLVFGG